jgi:hypothetical protein
MTADVSAGQAPTEPAALVRRCGPHVSAFTLGMIERTHIGKSVHLIMSRPARSGYVW